jgi:hypothetical protein
MKALRQKTIEKNAFPQHLDSFGCEKRAHSGAGEVKPSARNHTIDPTLQRVMLFPAV